MKKEKICGIYKIVNPEGQVYIGSSKDVYNRMLRGYKQQNRGKPRFIHSSLDKFGVENHQFLLIEECDEDILRTRERFWQEELNCLYPNGLNRNLVACEGKRQVNCEDAIRIMSVNRMGAPAWNKGIPTWESTKKTIRERYNPLNRKSSKIILDTRTGVYYYCLREASLAFNIPKQTLKMNLSAPNVDCRKNKTHLVYT